MSNLINLLIAGLATGAIYALIAIGFTLLWQTSQIINFAQGEFVMLRYIAARIEKALDRFPALRRKPKQQAGTLSCGEQKQLEIARGLLLDPKLILVDEPSIGLSPILVQETFAILTELRDSGVSVLMIEQNARAALQISDYPMVLELSQNRMFDITANILSDARVGQLFLGGAMTGAPA